MRSLSVEEHRAVSRESVVYGGYARLVGAPTTRLRAPRSVAGLLLALALQAACADTFPTSSQTSVTTNDACGYATLREGRREAPVLLQIYVGRGWVSSQAAFKRATKETSDGARSRALGSARASVAAEEDTQPRPLKRIYRNRTS